MMSLNPVLKAIKHFGGRTQVAKITGVSYMAVKKWERNGCFPRTEYTGETHYAKTLSQESDGVLSVTELLLRNQKTLIS
ncbi:Cro/CI family transcriptional regulator [Moraxella sp. ZY200743]|uniref:Cro/CI family transcriptional regulator n=1 Tax=Moraxella sp. ZY200743 TaxID=2911970 RepID=UPI003D7D1F3B